ncbi:hypothetical protein CTEN210_16892 [Chaetoceros tenuissimus]|uniref:Uncharacterized protein n=1 Tax=Chaetoceros tenuissimus TaxID=426638 RepID=A0AAD3D9L4_9STRA|nr:hypothetical protein CTEN210_16892 [Chaetoceros tenuissimus]
MHRVVSLCVLLVLVAKGEKLEEKKLRAISSTRRKVLSPDVDYSYNQLGDDLDGEDIGEKFASSMAISGDGNRLAIGAEAKQGKGGFYIFDWENDVWTLQSKQVLGGPNSMFGNSIAMSDDGNTLVVGSPNDFGGGGSIQIFAFDPASKDWISSAKFIGEGVDSAGTAVTISGDAKTVAYSLPSLNNFGGVKTLVMNGSWVESGTINSDAYTFFGGSLALTFDGQRLAVGERLRSQSTGGVKVYDYNSDQSEWIQNGQTLIGNIAGGRFGSDIDISGDGSRLVVAAMTANTQKGQIRVFDEDASLALGWSETFFVDGEAAHDRFGAGARISNDGSIIVIGAPESDDIGTNGGEVEVYQYDANASGNNKFKQVGIDIGGECSNDEFGSAVVVNGDGTRIVAASKKSAAEAGMVRAFEAVLKGTGTVVKNRCPTASPMPSHSPTISMAPSITPTESGANSKYVSIVSISCSLMLPIFMILF